MLRRTKPSTRPRRAGGTARLVQYRVLGGPADVDQRLTVFADGLVELDERHRSRDCTRLTIGPEELEQLDALLGQLPKTLWSRGPTIALMRARSVLRDVFKLWPEPDLVRWYFHLRLGPRSIAGEIGDEPEADAVIALLDDLRMRAVRLAESLKPTGTQSQ